MCAYQDGALWCLFPVLCVFSLLLAPFKSNTLRSNFKIFRYSVNRHHSVNGSFYKRNCIHSSHFLCILNCSTVLSACSQKLLTLAAAQAQCVVDVNPPPFVSIKISSSQQDPPRTVEADNWERKTAQLMEKTVLNHCFFRPFQTSRAAVERFSRPLFSSLHVGMAAETQQ